MFILLKYISVVCINVVAGLLFLYICDYLWLFIIIIYVNDYLWLFYGYLWLLFI